MELIGKYFWDLEIFINGIIYDVICGWPKKSWFNYLFKIWIDNWFNSNGVWNTFYFYDFRDKNGYYQITGRVDDVINVTGHRLGTAEVEDVMVNTILFSSRVIVTICLKLYSEFFKNSL